MKRILFVFISVFSFLIVTNAKVRDVKFIYEYNTGYQKFAFAEDDMIILHSPANNSVGAEVKGINIYGKELYMVDTKEFLPEKDYFYSYESIKKGQEKYDFNITKYNKKTGEKIKELYVPVNSSVRVLKVYFNEHGVVFKNYPPNDNSCFIVDRDLTSYVIPNNTNGLFVNDYNGFVSPYLVTDDEYNEVIDYLVDEEGYNESEIINHKILKYDGNYYTVIKKSGPVFSLIAIDEEEQNYSITSISQSNFATGVYRYNVVDFSIIAGNIVVIFDANAGCPTAYSVGEHIGDKCANNTYVQLYNIVYNVFTKTDGNGEIKYERKVSEDGEEISFELIPNEDYYLDSVKVYDSKGNPLSVVGNKFVMPSSDVTIEASFLTKGASFETDSSKNNNPENNNPKNNPLTKTFVGGIVLVAVISLITMIFLFIRINKTRNS